MDYAEVAAKANYRLTVAAQREALKLKFKSRCIYYGYGGNFTITAERLFMLKYLIDQGYERVPFLDDNETPILIEDAERTLQDMTKVYTEALNTYYADFKKLREMRSIEAVVG